MTLQKVGTAIKGLFLFLLLFLACFNFLGRGPVFFLGFSVFGILFSQRKKWCAICLVYLALSATAVVVSLVFYSFEESIKSLVFFLSFYAGYCIFVSNGDSEITSRLFFGAVLGFVALLAFFYYSNIIQIGHISGVREMIDPWTKKNISVTLIGLMSCVPIVYSFYCFFCQKRLLLKIIGLFYLTLSIWINIETATRTPFVLMLIVFLVMAFEAYKSDESPRKALRWVILFLIILGAGYYLFDRVADSVLAERFSDERLETTRWEIMGVYLDHMWEYPWGGGFVHKNYHHMAHNMIQELYDMYGFFFIVLFLIVLFGMVKRIIVLFRIKKKNGLLLLVQGLYIGIIIQSLLEPVVEGYPQLLWLLFMTDGVTVGMLEKRQATSNKYLAWNRTC